ncbi:MAG: hypothetical protein N3A57_06355 [Negativicutes bacterium]|nr:hypothetical protein [Negativicutes bacterium]
MKKIILVLAMLAVLTIPAAGLAARGDLVSYSLYGGQPFSTDQITGFVNNAGTTADALDLARQQIGPAQYPVAAYQIVYTSINHTGQQIPVSGVVLVPQHSSPMPLLVYQHATIIEDSSAPSDVAHSGQTQALMGAFATQGYVVAMSDFVGTGLETQFPSEYLYAASEAANGVDIIPAALTLLQKLGVQTNGRLFLSGYSEGGQAVSALADLIQGSYPQYSVTAAAFMEGPYDMTQVMNNFLQTPGGVKLDDMPVGSLICAKAIYAYQGIYNWGQMSTIFRYPYDVRVKRDFGQPNPPMWQLAADYPANTTDMFLPAFLKSAESGPVAANIAANDTNNWVPKMPVTFISSTGDTLIPFTVTQDTYQLMLGKGGNVKLLTTQYPLNHLQNFFPAVALSRTIFDPLAGRQ